MSILFLSEKILVGRQQALLNKPTSPVKQNTIIVSSCTITLNGISDFGK